MRTVEANGITMRIAEMGQGPLVIFLHGFPESWYSWRHQLPAVAKAGFHAVAPDLRGYGKSDKPANVEDYDIHHLSADVTGLIDALGEKTAVVVGHDWGSLVAWNAVLLHPDRFTALVAMSVPYGGRGAVSPLETMKKTFGDNFYYILYFQEPGVAEAEFDKDPRGILSRLYLSPDSPREPPQITDRRHQLLPQLPPQLGDDAGADRPENQSTNHVHRRRTRCGDRQRDRRTAHGDDEPGRDRFPRLDAHPRGRPLGAAGKARGDQRGASRVSGWPLEREDVTTVALLNRHFGGSVVQFRHGRDERRSLDRLRHM
jgi:pimeloyl-ACP methyl ester carboxylesterase